MMQSSTSDWLNTSQPCYEDTPISLPGWRFKRLIHSNSHSTITLVQNKNYQLAVIKQFHYDVNLLSDSQIQDFIEAVDRIRAIKNPKFIRIDNAGLYKGTFYLLMEYLPSPNLAETLLHNPTLSIKQRLDWFRDITLCLQSLHDAGLLHRDLKPSNIMFRDEELILVDCGIENQWLINAGYISEGEVHCTPSYVSPEHAAGEVCTVQSDIYSLGIILYELITFYKPFEAGTSLDLIKQHALAKVPLLPTAFEPLQDSLECMLAKHPDDRYRNIQTFLWDFDERRRRLNNLNT
ncbi:MAG: Serine/threonine protein kinase [uncultured Thiotrichaceae bacterium]|uniref:Serine/threonine protein kinase n=1 Tax=uncultured Thiotrichaceae bacterium TaxID=298394 RepID=A0A6S6SWL2_9GAMM|nr:MAG: Serine/threonine protein kinase [uncultured Thiotrichaceae bacterium]